MKTFDPLTNELIQAAFERRARRGDPAGLRESIASLTAGTAQRRSWRGWLPTQLVTPSLRPAAVALLPVIALLLAALAFALIGHQPRTPLTNGSWAPVAPMPQARAGFAATLLLDGRVLVAGGFTNEPLGTTAQIASCALYDPSTGTWTATGGMTAARADFTATRLLDGTVLVAGGTTNGPGSAALDSAELYDPRSGLWTTVGHMDMPRAGFTATLLPDGMVLVVGGYTDSTQMFLPNASADLYNPATRSWTATAPTLEARDGSTATLLQGGKVLVAGGVIDVLGPAVTATTELYDPSTGSWARTGAMIEARAWAAASVLPDGEVLVAGGHRGSGLHNDALASAELYDPSSGTWAATGSMLAPDAYMAPTLLSDGRVLVTGGYENDLVGGDAPELYDQIVGSWTMAGIGFAQSTEPTATLLLNGTVLIAGGSTMGFAHDAAEIYDPAGGS